MVVFDIVYGTLRWAFGSNHDNQLKGPASNVQILGLDAHTYVR